LFKQHYVGQMNIQQGAPTISPRYIIRLVRIKEWWDKLLHLTGSAALMMFYIDRVNIDLVVFMAYLAAIVCLLMGGYTINDAADFLQDKVADKKGMPKREHSLILSVASLTTSLILIYSIRSDILPILITVITILIGLEYSLPPIRFKERGAWGIIVGSATQKPALFMIFIAIISMWNWLSTVLTVWLFCGGMLGMLGHQILDYQNDLKSGVWTFVARYGPRPALLLSIICAAIITITIIAPLVFVPFKEALPIMCLLAVFSSVYLFKGLRSMKKIRAMVNV